MSNERISPANFVADFSGCDLVFGLIGRESLFGLLDDSEDLELGARPFLSKVRKFEVDNW